MAYMKIARSDDGIHHDVTVTITIGSVHAPEDWDMGKRVGEWQFYVDPEFEFGVSNLGPIASKQSKRALREKMEALIDNMVFSGEMKP